jgi:hypothetical protein
MQHRWSANSIKFYVKAPTAQVRFTPFLDIIKRHESARSVEEGFTLS